KKSNRASPLGAKVQSACSIGTPPSFSEEEPFSKSVVTIKVPRSNEGKPDISVPECKGGSDLVKIEPSIEDKVVNISPLETKVKQIKKGKKDSGRVDSSPTDQTLVRDDLKEGEGESSYLDSVPGGPTEGGVSSPYLLTVESVEGRVLDPYLAVSSDLKMTEVSECKLDGGSGETKDDVIGEDESKDSGSATETSSVETKSEDDDSEDVPKLGEGKFQVRATRKCSDIVADAMSLRINLKNMMRNESLDKDFARFLRTETKSFTAELLRVDKNPDPFSPSKMASLEARIRSLKGLSPVKKEAKNVTAEDKLIKKVEDEQEISLSPGFRSSLKEIYVDATVQVLSGDSSENTESADKKEGSVDEEIENVESEAAGDVEKEVSPKMKAGPLASETKGNGLEAGPCDTKTELGRNEADGNATTETVQVILKSDNFESNVCSGLVNGVENGFGLNPTKSVGEERKRFEYREQESEDASKVFVKMFKPNIQEAALSPRGEMRCFDFISNCSPTQSAKCSGIADSNIDKTLANIVLRSGDMKDKENLAHQVFDGFTKQNLSLSGSVTSETIDSVPKVGQPVAFDVVGCKGGNCTANSGPAGIGLGLEGVLESPSETPPKKGGGEPSSSSLEKASAAVEDKKESPVGCEDPLTARSISHAIEGPEGREVTLATCAFSFSDDSEGILGRLASPPSIGGEPCSPPILAAKEASPVNASSKEGDEEEIDGEGGEVDSAAESTEGEDDSEDNDGFSEKETKGISEQGLKRRKTLFEKLALDALDKAKQGRSPLNKEDMDVVVEWLAWYRDSTRSKEKADVLDPHLQDGNGKPKLVNNMLSKVEAKSQDDAFGPQPVGAAAPASWASVVAAHGNPMLKDEVSRVPGVMAELVFGEQALKSVTPTSALTVSSVMNTEDTEVSGFAASEESMDVRHFEQFDSLVQGQPPVADPGVSSSFPLSPASHHLEEMGKLGG
ncbi:hypothetical protein U1Q18_031298, partial [Sarracenia purpurea var. burkii]